jgi:DNA repair protein RadC
VKKISDIPILDRPRENLRQKGAKDLSDRATAVIIAHNHPTGNVTPSREDTEITETLKAAGETLGIRVLDHIIFSHKGYYSFLENNGL